jgi:hypothetical protein
MQANALNFEDEHHIGYNAFNVCMKGDPHFRKDFVKSESNNFDTVYRNRPIEDNTGGTGRERQFALWLVVR